MAYAVADGTVDALVAGAETVVLAVALLPDDAMKPKNGDGPVLVLDA